MDRHPSKMVRRCVRVPAVSVTLWLFFHRLMSEFVSFESQIGPFLQGQEILLYCNVGRRQSV